MIEKNKEYILTSAYIDEERGTLITIKISCSLMVFIICMITSFSLKIYKKMLELDYKTI